jgi:dipeptidyl aminopeptidase/acylaminoacyl peptidase
MTPDRFDRRFAEALDDLAAPAFPVYLDTVLRVTAETRQRPAWTFPERWLPMSTLVIERVSSPARSLRPIALLLVIALLLAALAVVVSSPRPLPAPFGPAGNGLLAFDRGGDIYLRDPSDGSTDLLVRGAENDVLPEFSPDGTELLFLRRVPQGDRVLVVPVGGGTPVEVTDEPLRQLTSWSWSPDGRAIAMASMIAGYQQVTIGQADGSGVRVLDLGTPIDTPAWRPPDGKELLVRYRVGHVDVDLAVVAADGSSVRKLDVPGTGISNPTYELLGATWSPDGSRIAYHTLHPGDLFRRHVIGADGTDDRVLTSGPREVNEGWNVWSPDGSRLAFGRWIWDRSNGFAVAAADGSGASVDLELRGDPLDTEEDMKISWAPDGLGIYGHQLSMHRVVLIDPATGSAEDAGFPADNVPNWQRVAP